MNIGVSDPVSTPRLKASEHEPEARFSVLIKAKLQPGGSNPGGEQRGDGRALMRTPALGAQVEPACLVPERQAGMG